MLNRALLLLMIALLALVACGGEGSTTVEPGAEATVPVAQVEPTSETVLNTGEAPAPATDEATMEAPATEMLATEAPPTATTAPTILCPDLPRPALILSVGPGFEAYSPQSDERCSLPLPETMAYLQPGGDRLYFVTLDYESGNSVVARLHPDGSVEPLEATRTDGTVHYHTRFAIAGDESRLAWTRMVAHDDPNATEFFGSLWIGANETSEVVTVFEDVLGDELRIIRPIRFSADGATLFFTWEPTGLGGMWSAFNGRFDNLYRVPVTGGEPKMVFDCAAAELFLCIGDFLDDNTLAYIDMERAIHVLGPDGAELSTIPTSGDYAGYPTFSPSGDLVYSEAVLPASDEAVPLPSPGTVYRVAAPYTGQPVVVATADGLLPSALPYPFLDNDHVVVQYQQGDMWGTALLNMSGEITPLEPWPNAYLASVWPGN